MTPTGPVEGFVLPQKAEDSAQSRAGVRGECLKVAPGERFQEWVGAAQGFGKAGNEIVRGLFAGEQGLCEDVEKGGAG